MVNDQEIETMSKVLAGQPLYTAKNLEDIAQFFEKRAKGMREQGNRAKTNKQRDIDHTAATTWEAAAYLLRRTKLKR